MNVCSCTSVNEGWSLTFDVHAVKVACVLSAGGDCCEHSSCVFTALAAALPLLLLVRRRHVTFVAGVVCSSGSVVVWLCGLRSLRSDDTIGSGVSMLRRSVDFGWLVSFSVVVLLILKTLFCA